MRVSRLVIRNFRIFESLDIDIDNDLLCVIGENNTGKTALFRALQMCVDHALPSVYRSLTREDVHTSVDVSFPSQVLIGIELCDFRGKVNEEALVCTWKTAADTARLYYRFRPRSSIREALQAGEIDPGELKLDDYSWEIKGGGNPATDLTKIKWDDDIGESVRFSDFQSFLVVHLPALRDVESDLRNMRHSPLRRLIDACEIEEEEQEQLIDILTTANKKIEASETIGDLTEALDSSFKMVSGPAFEMDIAVGISPATFHSIVRNMKMLLSDGSLHAFEPRRNGLGMNNILYISILVEYLKKRQSVTASSGQLVLIEEPEAHLHPQLQAALLTALKDIGVQVVLTTHSTQITSIAPMDTLVTLTRKPDASVASSSLTKKAGLSPEEISDLERYLDSTKSNLLFARKVMLVEGASELFLIPALVEAVLGINLEREGISIVAIHGVHFQVFAKLFQAGALEKKCAIVSDADLKPSDAGDEFELENDAPALNALRGDYVEVFAGQTTFERELVSLSRLPMLIAATEALRAPRIHKKLVEGLELWESGTLSPQDEHKLHKKLGKSVLNTAKRFGKARFAQVAARNAHLCGDLPEYIQQAIDWLNEE